MGSNTKIEWADSTWSPVRVRVRPDAAEIALAKGYTSLISIAEKMAGHPGSHCEHVSPGCEHCYAETNNHRCLPANGTGLPYDRRSRDLVEAFVDEKALLLPLKWKPIPQYDADDGERYPDRPRRIFVENQSDLFGEWVTDEMRDWIFAVMALCPQHTFQVLTKRPAEMLRYLDYHFRVVSPGPRERIFGVVQKMPGYDPEHPKWLRIACEAFKGDSRGVLPLPNVWLGVSVEDQETADERIPLLLQTPAAKRFISAEPLLGKVTLLWKWVSKGHPFGGGPMVNLLRPWEEPQENAGLDWVICGGESGPGARPMHPDWARSLRDQCQAAGVPFFFKQWGAWWPGSNARVERLTLYDDGRICDFTREAILDEEKRSGKRHRDGNPIVASRVGRKAAGALLDGREWREFPK